MALTFIFLDQELWKFIKFILIAVVRTALDILIWRYLVNLLQPESFLVKKVAKLKLNRYALAQVFAFIISLFISYLANSILVFEDGNRSRFSELISYISVSVISFLSSTFYINFITSNKYILKKIEAFTVIKNHWPILAKIQTVAITVLINFTGYNFFVFV